MANENSKRHAFPEIKTEQALKDKSAQGNAYGNTYSVGGLTKREYFIGQILSGRICMIENSDEEVIAKYVIKLADELLKQLEK